MSVEAANVKVVILGLVPRIYRPRMYRPKRQERGGCAETS
ncbi:hypothetical protein SAMN04487976_102368 [Xaviernesmea oryzae]|nr:hypothetical protein SAMN04487976_102368 [Xaviernesmea oryzae]